jgi:hypothetical protein
MRDEESLREAIEKLGLELVAGGVNKTHTLYNNQKAKGIAFKLPGWSYPVVVNPETGEAKYDNYKGSWGKQSELDKLVLRYSVCRIEKQAETEGYSVVEESLENGDVELVMTAFEY